MNVSGMGPGPPRTGRPSLRGRVPNRSTRHPASKPDALTDKLDLAPANPALCGLAPPPPRLRPSSGDHGSALRISPEVTVDVHEAEVHARRLIDRAPDAVAAVDLRLDRGDELQAELLPDCYHDWVLVEESA